LQVIYVDVEIGSPGDGGTPATAVNALPAFASLVASRVYLIRRRDAAINVAYGSCSQPDVHLIGMPLEDDWLYPFVPEEAKTAWGSDDFDTHVDIFPSAATAQATFQNDAGDIGFHRLRFNLQNYADATAPVNGMHFNVGAATADPAANFGKSGYMTNCEWYSENGHIDGAGVTIALNSCFTYWLYVHGFNNFRFEHNKIVYPGRSAGYAATTGIEYKAPFYFVTNQIVTIRDIDAWIGTDYQGVNTTYNSTRPLFWIQNTAEYEFSNVLARHVVQQAGTPSDLRGLLRVDGTNMTRRISRVKSRIERFFQPGNRPSLLALSAPVIELATSLGAVGTATREERPRIWDEDIDIDTTPCWTSNGTTVFAPTTLPYVGFPVLKLWGPTAGGYATEYVTNFVEGACKNIKVTVPATGGIGEPNIPYALDLSFPFSHCRPGEIGGFDLKNPRCGSLFFEGNTFGATGKAPANVATPPIKLGNLEGIIHIRQAGMMEINKVTVARPNTWAGFEGSSVYIDEVAVDKAAWNNTMHPFFRWVNSRVVINRLNIPVILPVNTIPINVCYGRTGLIINSENEHDGKSKFTNGWYHGENYNVYREGGAPSSIRLYGRSDLRNPLQVGFEPYRNIRVTAEDPGKYILKLYAITAGFTVAQEPKLPRRVVVQAQAWEAEQFADGSGSALQQRLYDSQTHGAWRRNDEEVVWKNEEIYNAYVMEMPLDLPDPGASGEDTLTVDVRLEFDFYAPDGFFYFDPLVELEPVV
jgi:hypothetical protein